MPGLYFDELTVGQTFKHALSRTVTEADNVFFSALTHNPALLHLDEHYCREHTEFGQRIVNSAFTLGLMVGISVGDTTQGTAIANLGWDEVRFPKPLFHGDTVRGRDRGRGPPGKQVPTERRHRDVHPSRLQPARRPRRALPPQRAATEAASAAHHRSRVK